jgi:two-component system, cell cycle sensor histidine kinase and response regulator CckA
MQLAPSVLKSRARVESELQFDVMFRASPLPSVLMRVSDLVFVAVNDAYIATFGWEREELIGRSALELDWFADKRGLDALNEGMQRDGRVRNLEIRGRHRNGETRTVLISVETVVINAEPHTLTVLNDVTALRASEARFVKAFEASPLPQVLIRAGDRAFIAANDAFVSCFGYSRDEIIGTCTDDLPFYVRPADRQLMIDSLAGHGQVVNQEVHLRTRAGRICTVILSVVAIDIDGEPTLLTVAHDISEQKASDAALRASETRFAHAFTKNPLPVTMIRECDGHFIDVNEAFVKTFGYERHELIGFPVQLIDLWVDQTEREATYAKFRAEGRLTEHPVRFATKSGEQRDLLWSMERIDIGGDAGVMCTMQDVTKRKRDEAALRDSEARFAAAFWASPVPMSIVGVADQAIITVNDAFLRLFGYAREEVVGRLSTEFNFYADPKLTESAHEVALKKRRVEGVELQLLSKSGAVLDVLVSSEMIDIAGTQSLLGVFQDITERKQGELALRDSESRFRQIAENIREVFWLAEPDLSRIVYVSPAYETIWGRPVGRLYANALDWINAIHVDDRERVVASAAAQILSGNYEEQYRIVRPDGEVRWIHDRGFPVRDAGGTMIRFAGFAEDVTQRLQLEDELRQTQKMESLGMLAGGVAHDFNNVLAVIASCNGLLGEDIPSDAPNRELVDEIEAAVNRAAALTRQLLAFSRKQVTEPKVVDLNAIVNETRKMLRRMVGEDVILSTSLDPDLGRVRVDPGYLVQVLMNLAVNARDAMPRGGTLTLTTRNAMIDEHHVRRHPCAKRGPATLIAVSDTGTGMAPDVVARIFEPFFTTKAHGKGTGMGLAVVHGIIDQAGGLIEVDSVVDVGTTFRVYLPIVDADVEAADDMVKSTACGSERILLVDDDHHVRRSAARALRARGYDVSEAEDGETALDKLATSRSFDLLLTDVVMPAMDGRQLAEEALKQFGELKVLYMSGYTDDAVVRHGVMDGMVELIEKPFRIDSLARKVRQLLDQ